MSNSEFDERSTYKQSIFMGVLFTAFILGILLSSNAIADKFKAETERDSVITENDRLKSERDSLQNIADSVMYPINDINGVKNYIE